MLSFEPELESLRSQLGDAATDALVARERREVFSVYPELRLAGWLGAMLLAAAAGLTLKNNLDRIGPVALAVLIGIAAAACYTWTWLRRSRATVVDDYVLLLGALLVSADVAFIESQFHLLDAAWKHHLLVIAVFHAIGAYVYGSRMLLSLSIVALAGWIGFSANDFFGAGSVWRPALLAAIAVIAWREIDRRVVSSVSSRAKSRDSLPNDPSPTSEEARETTPFSRTFEHFAANFALIGGLALSDDQEILGSLVTMAIAAGVIAWGFAVRSEPFVLYGFVYFVIAFDVLVIQIVERSTVGVMLVIVLSMIGAIAGLLALHARFKEAKA